MALTRFLFAVLLVCCLSFAIEKPAMWYQMNMKARQKWERAISGDYKGKSTGPAARDKFWASMRSDDSNNKTVPTHKYVEAQNFFLSQQSETKRYYNSPWTNIGPNTNNKVGGRTRAILVTSTGTLYAGCVSGGLWKSTNGGKSWTVLTDMMANIAVSAIGIDSSGSIYVGTGEGYNSADSKRGNGIFKSRNDVFTQLSSTANANFYYVNKIVVSDKDEIYAATRTGLFVSSDGGASFSTLLKGNVMDAAIAKLNGNNVIVCWSSGYGLFASTDGSNFKQVIGTSSQDNSMYRGSIAVSPSSPNIIYISLSSNSGNIVSVYKSTNGGQSFTSQLLLDTSNSGRLNSALLSNPFYNIDTGSGYSCSSSVSSGGYNQGWYDNAIAVNPLNPNIVYIGGVDLFKSSDGGKTFNLISTWWSSDYNYLHADQHTIVFSPSYATDNTVYIGNDGGIYQTQNLDAGYYSNPCSPPSQGLPTYVPINSNYGTLQFYHGSAHPSYLIAGCQDNGSWKMTSQWGAVSGGDGGFTVIESDTVYYTSNTYTSLTRHANDKTSTILKSGSLDGNGIFINPVVMDTNKWLYTCGKSCYRCKDGSAPVWEALGNPLDQSISAIAVSKNWIYYGGTQGGFYRADITSGNWQKVGQSSLCPDCGDFYISSISISPTNSNEVFVTISSFGDPHLWKSTDGGLSWFSLSSNIPDVPALDLLVLPSGTLYLGTDLGIIYSYDNGSNWLWINEFGLANVPIYKFQFLEQSQTIYAFSHGRGVYKSVITTTGSTSWIQSTISSTIWDGSTIGDAAPMETSKKNGGSFWIIVGSSVGGGLIIIVATILGVLLRRKHRKRSPSQEQILGGEVPVSMNVQQ